MLSDDPPFIKNFARIDDRVWRGSRPSREDAAWLADAGVKSAINLEWAHSDDAAFEELPIRLLPAKDWEPLPWLAPSMEDAHIRRFLTQLWVAEPPTYVHCRSGQNRTGVAIAAYQIIECDLALDLALANFQRFRGFWARKDAIYIRGLYARKWQFSPDSAARRRRVITELSRKEAEAVHRVGWSRW